MLHHYAIFSSLTLFKPSLFCKDLAMTELSLSFQKQVNILFQISIHRSDSFRFILPFDYMRIFIYPINIFISSLQILRQ